MASVDNVLAMKEHRRCEKLAKEQERWLKSEAEVDRLHQVVTLASSSSSSDEWVDNSYQCASTSSSSKPPAKKRGRHVVITPDLAATLDRHKISSWSAVMVVGEAAKSVGQDVSSLTINKSSIHRQRQQCRAQYATDIKQNFRPDTALIVHWDGKILPDITGQEMVDRLPILVSSCGQSTDARGSQLLVVPKLLSGTGAAQASAVFDALNEWKIADNVKGVCFDTTSSNTGLKSGACVTLEHLLGHDLLHLACRHHILELVAGAAFSGVMSE